MFIEPLGQWIRENSKIKGINIKDDEHKLSLFADDILVYLKDPTESLVELLELLQTFGSFSGFTQVLTFNYNPPNEIKKDYSLKWDLKFIKYLGINIPKDMNNLEMLNYGHINKKIKLDIARWNLLPFFNMRSRIDSVKQNILPRLLFQSLPVSLPKKQFSEWDKLLSRFIWQGKKPRVKFKTLQLSKERGGV